MCYVIVDLEATCWRKGTTVSRQEIIEIGAVLLRTPDDPAPLEFARFVRPVNEPQLSDFCINLTSIQQTDVDGAEHFPAVLADFLNWIECDDYHLCSWGGYDLRQFDADCQKHGLPLPAMFEQHLNLKQMFGEWQNKRSMGMKRALEILNIPLEGTHHRGIDDARNIAKIARVMLPACGYK